MPRLASRPPTPRAGSPTVVERLLQGTGADPAFLDVVLGDLAEEFAGRAARDGVGAARWWYGREALRAVPHLLRSWLRHVRRHHPARLAAWLAAGVVASCLAAVALLAVKGPPAHLVMGAGGADDGFVVNTVRPVRLPLRVLDAAGRVLASEGLRYRWVAGTPVGVTPDGVVTCARRGDATVRAALGPLATDVLVRCRPLRDIRAAGWNDFVLGDPARELPVAFVGVDGRPVTRLAARVRVGDSTVATLDGLRIRPRSPGQTQVHVDAGGHTGSGLVTVFEPAPSLEGLHPDQRFVAAPVRLARGASVRWPLPTGLFYLVRFPDADGRPAPALAVGGPVTCLLTPGSGARRSHCLARAPGAFVIVMHPGSTASEVGGTIALAREERR